jgi:hypothetical protein
MRRYLRVMAFLPYNSYLYVRRLRRVVVNVSRPEYLAAKMILHSETIPQAIKA